MGHTTFREKGTAFNTLTQQNTALHKTNAYMRSDSPCESNIIYSMSRFRSPNIIIGCSDGFGYATRTRCSELRPCQKCFSTENMAGHWFCHCRGTLLADNEAQWSDNFVEATSFAVGAKEPCKWGPPYCSCDAHVIPLWYSSIDFVNATSWGRWDSFKAPWAWCCSHRGGCTIGQYLQHLYIS